VLFIIYNALDILIYIIVLLILARSILSWFPNASGSYIGNMLVTLTEPILSPIKRFIMKFQFARSSSLDFTPMAAILLLFLLQRIIAIIFYALGA
jgi:YggT family protein